MSSGCGDVLSLADLQTAKKHQIFEAEVITGKSGGVAGGADIDCATNPVTGQAQKTLPAVLRDAGFTPVAWDFSTGGVLSVNDRDKVVYDPVSKTWYAYAGVLPVTVPAGFNPVGNANWKPRTDPNLRQDLAAVGGAALIGSADGQTVQQHILRADSADYRNRNIRNLTTAHFKLRTKSGLSILCQGDSETFGWDPNSTDATGSGLLRKANVDYPSRLARYLTKCTGGTVTTVTRAVSGQTAQQGYNYASWQTSPNCDIAVLMYGINDSTADTNANYLNYMELMIRRFINWGMGVIVLQPVCGGNEQHGNTQTFQIWAQELRNMAHVYGCAYVEANEIPYNLPYGVVASDPIHFNSVGYQRIAEAIGSMMMAGGMLPYYRPVSSEITVWPYKQSDQLGFFDAFNNLTMGYGTGAYTLQGIVGGFDAGKYVRTSYSFYLDAEAAEVDVVGSWVDGSKLYFTFTEDAEVPPSSGVAYYPLASPNSTVQSNYNAIQTTTTVARNRGSNNHSDAVQKRIGTLVGRGWKTVSIFSATDSSSTANGFVQALTIRPVYEHLARQTNNGFARGFVESLSVRIPSPIVPGSAWPGETTLSTVDFPLPSNLRAEVWDQTTNPWDCGTAKLIIKSIGGTHGNGYLEAIIRRTTTGLTGFTVDVLHSSGTWPTITASLGTATVAKAYTQNQLAVGMPQRDIDEIGSFAAQSNASKYGHLLRLTFTWAGTALNGYYTMELQSASEGSGATRTVGY